MISDEESESDVTEGVNDEEIEEPIDIENLEDIVTSAETVPKVTSEENEEEDSGEWSFETDHVVLKNNHTYQELLKTVVTLQVQRVQMVEDLETLHDVKKQALMDPMAFLKKMENRECLGIPPRIKIAKIPEIDWSQYNIGPRNFAEGPATRGFAQKVTSATDNDQEEEEVPIRVRGRPFNESKPQTFNQLWTSEEQQRLEELLVEYPPEERESRRWGKIAAALGNRTKNQVTSRVQKYFIKLHQAGLPVPGRIPRTVSSGHRHAHQRYNHHLFRPTTFFPNHPSMGNDADDQDQDEETTRDGPDSEWSSASDSDMEAGSDTESDDETMNISEKVAEAEAVRTVRLLERVVEDKEKDVPDAPIVSHSKYKCDLCEEEPLLGTRWHCAQCSADYCGECVVTQLDSANPHPSNHHLVAIRTPN